MIVVLARFEMKPEHELATLEAISEMCSAVRADEQGCLVYTVTRGKVNPLELYFYEVYDGTESFDAHRKTSHFREMQAIFDETLSRTSFNVEVLKHIDGFIRPEAEAYPGDPNKD
jgi:quinol monooxygenase YgiN